MQPVEMNTKHALQETLERNKVGYIQRICETPLIGNRVSSKDADSLG